MKICILGDTHFGARSDSIPFHNYMEKFYSEFFFPELEKRGVDTIIQLGDLFDRRKFINFNTLYRCRGYFFNPARDKQINVYVFPGNHDTFFKTTNEINSLSLLLGEYENITCVYEPSVIEFDEVPIAMIPWICPENEKRCFDFIDKTNAQILLGHLELAGFEMYRGTFCHEGLDEKVFSKFDMVLSGHYHTRSSRGNIHYLGTPYELTWGDWNDPRGIHIFDTDTRELEFIENPYKMFNKLFYDDTSIEFDDIVNLEIDHVKDTIVKLVVRNKTNPFWFDQFVSRIEKLGVVNLQIVEDNLYLDLEDGNDEIENIEDTLTVLKSYTEQIDSVDNQKLNSLMLDIYNEAVSLTSE